MKLSIFALAVFSIAPLAAMATPGPTAEVTQLETEMYAHEAAVAAFEENEGERIKQYYERKWAFEDPAQTELKRQQNKTAAVKLAKKIRNLNRQIRILKNSPATNQIERQIEMEQNRLNHAKRALRLHSGTDLRTKRELTRRPLLQRDLPAFPQL